MGGGRKYRCERATRRSAISVVYYIHVGVRNFSRSHRHRHDPYGGERRGVIYEVRSAVLSSTQTRPTLVPTMYANAASPFHPPHRSTTVSSPSQRVACDARWLVTVGHRRRRRSSSGARARSLSRHLFRERLLRRRRR